jgi:ABC-2 type transport system permease protein
MKGLRSPLTLVVNCILPLVVIFVPPFWELGGFMGDRYAGFGILAMVIWSGAFLMAQGILNDRESGTIVRILSGPVSMFNYLVQNLLAFMVPLTIQVGLISVIGMILHDWNAALALGLFVCYTVFTVASVAMSFAWNCLFKRKETSFTTFSAVLTFGIFLSGALLPITLFPDVVQYAGMIFPAYWAVRGIEVLLESGMTGEYWISIGAMALFTIAFLLYGGKRRMI